MTDDRRIPGTWPEQLAGDATAQLTPKRAASRRLGGAMRDVIERLVSTEAPIEVLHEAADALIEIAARFEGYPSGGLYEGFAESANAGNPRAMFDHSPLLGKTNPLAPPIDLEIFDDHVKGFVTFGSAYEGPPGCVHGGFVAAAFDEVLGVAQSLSGTQGMTAFLHVDYRRPTPLRTRLEYVGEIDRVEGRKIFTRGRVLAGETVTAEAQALFISLDPSRFAELRARREAQRQERG
jgi:acyl-coenzyme A thioesterase PaaI-like protein